MGIYMFIDLNICEFVFYLYCFDCVKYLWVVLILELSLRRLFFLNFGKWGYFVFSKFFVNSLCVKSCVSKFV